MKTLEIINEAGYLIPLKELDKERVTRAEKNHLIRIYNENQCKKCPYLEDRHSENCDNCASFIGARQTCKKVVYKNKEYLSIPRGRRDYIEKLAQVLPHDQIKIKSSYRDLPMSRRIKLLPTTNLRDYQVAAKDIAIKKKRGIIKSPPRSGKTLIGTAIICEIGQKAIIIAHQREWLVQFRETFLGSRTQEGFTNARESQIGFAKTLADFDKYDVCLCTFSQFFSEKGKSILAAIRKKFAVVLIDEVHGTPALATSRCLSQFSAKWVIGLSGTPERKCFLGDTLVSTPEGDRPISSLQDGDSILSPKGGADSVRAPFSRRTQEIVELVTVSGKILRGVPGSLVKTQRGWVPIEDITSQDSVETRG